MKKDIAKGSDRNQRAALLCSLAARRHLPTAAAAQDSSTDKGSHRNKRAPLLCNLAKKNATAAGSHHMLGAARAKHLLDQLRNALGVIVLHLYKQGDARSCIRISVML